MSMRNVAKQYSFIEKDTVSIKYSNFSRGAGDGSPNGSNDSMNMDLKVLKTKASLQNEFRERPLNKWSKRFFLSEQNWKPTRADALPSLELGLKSFIGNLYKERSVWFPRSLPFPEFSLDMARQEELRKKEPIVRSHIRILQLNRWAIFSRQILSVPDTSGGLMVLFGSIPFTLWMLQGIQFSPVSSQINRPSLCAGIWSQHGDLWASPAYLKWIMRWLPQVEDVILIVSLKSFDFTCFWEFTWFLSRRENPEGMHLLKALMNSGKREFLGDIFIPALLCLEEPANDSCSIIIMRNHIGVLLKKSMAQDFLEYSETVSGNLLDICQRDLALINTLIPMVILICQLQKESFPLLERLMLMAGSRSTALRILSEENLKASMSLLQLILIRNDWRLNKGVRIRSSSLFLFQSGDVSLFLCFQLQEENLNAVHDVMSAPT